MHIRGWTKWQPPPGGCSMVATRRLAAPPGRLDHGAGRSHLQDVGLDGAIRAREHAGVSGGRVHVRGRGRHWRTRPLDRDGPPRCFGDHRRLVALGRGSRSDPEARCLRGRKRYGSTLEPEHWPPLDAGSSPLNAPPLDRSRWRGRTAGSGQRPPRSEHAADGGVASGLPEQLETTCSRRLPAGPLRRGSSTGVARTLLIVDVAILAKRAPPWQVLGKDGARSGTPI